MKAYKIAFWVSSGIMSLILLASAIGYIFKYDDVVTVFEGLKFPAFIIIPLAIAKICGVIVVLTRKFGFLTDWAYAGIFFNALLALGAHLNISDKEWLGAVLILILVVISKYTSTKAFGSTAIK